MSSAICFNLDQSKVLSSGKIFIYVSLSVLVRVSERDRERERDRQTDRCKDRETLFSSLTLIL